MKSINKEAEKSRNRLHMVEIIELVGIYAVRVIPGGNSVKSFYAHHGTLDSCKVLRQAYRSIGYQSTHSDDHLIY